MIYFPALHTTVNRLSAYLFLYILTVALSVEGQNNVLTEKQFIRGQISILASGGMHGRGYVKNGVTDAAKYIRSTFQDLHLRTFNKAHDYVQEYEFPVNTFPGEMYLSLNKRELIPGADYIIDVASPSFAAEKLKGENIDLATLIKTTDNSIDSALTDSAWLATLSSFDTKHIYRLDHVDSFCRAMRFKPRGFSARLPKGCYIIPEKTKLTWDVAKDTIAATVFYIKQDALPDNIKNADIEVQSLFIPAFHNENLIGYIPGTVNDTFIAFTAHYDHLGMMGDTTFFPGASDNASGTATMLYLISYFATHPQHYSMLFIAFSGEEAGLMGSSYYVEHPIVPLKNIKFLTNIDILGDASDGITVVNATEFPKEFSLLQKINDSQHYIPAIKSRGKAANSDHYFFTEKGVPSFFMYSNGGKGYYHDIYDAANEITLNHVDGVVKLLIDFVKELK